MADLFGNPRESFAYSRRVDSGLPAMRVVTDDPATWSKRLDARPPQVYGPVRPTDILPARTIESKDGARAKCKPSRGYAEGALLPQRGHAMGGPTSPGNWTTLASGHDQRGTPYTMTDYVGSERRAYAKAHVKGPSTTRRVLNANLDAEPTTEFRQPGGPGQVGR